MIVLWVLGFAYGRALFDVASMVKKSWLPTRKS